MVGTISFSTASMAPEKWCAPAPAAKYSNHAEESSGSHAVLLAFDCGINAFQKPAHFLHRLDGNEFDPILILQYLQFLSRLEAQRFANLAGNDDLKLRGHGDDWHAHLIDKRIVQR